MRVLAIILITIIGITTAIGCAENQAGPNWSSPQVNPVLLFDRHAGTPTASRMAYRDSWPSTLSLYQRGESIHYRERFIDIQRAGPSGRGRLGYTYRRFDTLREGSAIR